MLQVLKLLSFLGLAGSRSKLGWVFISVSSRAPFGVKRNIIAHFAVWASLNDTPNAKITRLFIRVSVLGACWS